MLAKALYCAKDKANALDALLNNNLVLSHQNRHAIPLSMTRP